MTKDYFAIFEAHKAEAIALNERVQQDDSRSEAEKAQFAESTAEQLAGMDRVIGIMRGATFPADK